MNYLKVILTSFWLIKLKYVKGTFSKMLKKIIEKTLCVNTIGFNK